MSINPPALRLESLKTHYDVIVVGGGIYGAAVLWEATLRGLSVILIEKSDFGAATSANSLKMIHGGIRYLQNLDVRRTRESVRERRALMRIAPHLVFPLKCVMPTYRELMKSRPALWAGFKLYDLLAFDRNMGLENSKNIPPGYILSRNQLEVMLPELADKSITGCAVWYEGQVYNSERFVLSLILSATKSGANALNYTEVTDYQVYRNQIKGVTAQDILTGKQLGISGDIVIDCTGTWNLSQQLHHCESTLQYTSSIARAVNIVIRQRMAEFGVGSKVRVTGDEEKNSRLLFMVPWREGSIVGTWYFPIEGTPDKARLDKEELEFCIEQANSAFPDVGISKKDVTLIHLGTLPLDDQRGGDVEDRLKNQSTILLASELGGPQGLILVQGVKWTTARNAAKIAIDKAAQLLDKPVNQSCSDLVPIHGGNIVSFEHFFNECRTRYDGLFSIGTLVRLIKNYGSHVHEVIELAKQQPIELETVPGAASYLRGELAYVAQNEMVYTLTDLVMRRLDLGSMALPNKTTIDYCASYLAKRLEWDSETRHENINKLLAQYPVMGN